MQRCAAFSSRPGLLCLLRATARTSDVPQQLYENKVLLLRGFYSSKRLTYDASGIVRKGGTPGDWASDGGQALDCRPRSTSHTRNRKEQAKEHDSLKIEANIGAVDPTPAQRGR
jgi:hypothetical protein